MNSIAGKFGPLETGHPEDNQDIDGFAAPYTDQGARVGSEAKLDRASVPTSPQHYIATLVLLTTLVLGTIAVSNRLLIPWLHMPIYQEKIAQTMQAGENFGLFDLNIDIRGIRQAQFALLERAPEVMLLGASQWQEASADLFPDHKLFNAHIHRDYYDDIAATVGLLIKNDILPRTLVISIRDSTFTSVDNRTDWLWTPFIREYMDAEKMFGITPRPWLENFQPKEFWGLFSLPSVIDMSQKWLEAVVPPGPTHVDFSQSLDILMSDGSIRWSGKHQAIFTQKRSIRLSTEMAQSYLNRTPEISPHAVAALTKVFERLEREGTEVILVHPPFNPAFYDQVVGSVYEKGLHKVAALTRGFARKHGFKVAGSFDPSHLGCEATMFIDAEHSGPPCIARAFEDIASHISR